MYVCKSSFVVYNMFLLHLFYHQFLEKNCASFRKCKEPNHIPLRCDEVEKPDELKARIYIEDRMTEALVR